MHVNKNAPGGKDEHDEKWNGLAVDTGPAIDADATSRPEPREISQSAKIVEAMFDHVEKAKVLLLEVFYTVDTNGKGNLNLHEFAEVLVRMKFKVPNFNAQGLTPPILVRAARGSNRTAPIDRPPAHPQR